jgi:hypothetical protein
MKENIKIGLLGIIALTLVFDTFIMDKDSSNGSSNIASSNIVANPTTPTNNIMPEKVITPPVQKPPTINRPTTKVSFADASHNFGEIMQDSKNTYVFKFTNTGKEPLVIENASGSCGCTVPTYPKEPIAPGATGEIEVVYSPGKQQGEQNKTVSITANTEPNVTTLNVSATVKTP